MYFPADPHTGILASTEDGSGGNKRPRLTLEERKERDRERTRRYRAMLSDERKREIREIQRNKVAERRVSFSEDKRNHVRIQNAKRARERRAEKKMAMVLAGAHTQKPTKRRSRRGISDKRSRALGAVRGATRGLFEPLAPTLGKARVNRAAAAAAAANNLSSSHVHALGVGLPDSDGNLLEGLDMDEDIHNLPPLSATGHHQVLHHADTDSEEERGTTRPAVLPMAAPDFQGNNNMKKTRRRK